MEAGELISIRNVSHGYDLHGENRIILNDINLEVKRGEFITIVGITGSGKSTLLKLILGVVKPISGEIKIEGKVVAKPNKEVGIVFQKYSLFENRTAKENVLLGLQLGNFNLFRFLKNIFKNGDTKRGLENRAKLFLDKVGLKDHGDKYPYQLSGGMRQRISIAQTLITEPKLLLMDEPFGSLDIGTREEMQIFLIEQWKLSKQTIIFVTHDLEEALFLGTRIIVLSPFGGDNTEGSKIVRDVPIPWPNPRSTKVKHTREFNELMYSLRRLSLNPQSVENIENFDKKYEESMASFEKSNYI